MDYCKWRVTENDLKFGVHLSGQLIDLWRDGGGGWMNEQKNGRKKVIDLRGQQR